MPVQTSPFIEAKYGWAFAESGWNTGMDENLLKFSFMFDGNIDGVVSSLPTAVNGQAYFLTTDNRLYFAANTTWYSTVTPKWFQMKIRSSGDIYQFNGTAAVQIDSPAGIEARLDAVELTVSTLGTAAFEDVVNLVTQSQLDISEANSASYADGVSGTAESNANNYTDVLRGDLSSTSGLGGTDNIGFDGSTSDAVFVNAKSLANYTALRAYTGVSTGIRLTDKWITGTFQYDSTDTTSIDNGGTIIVDASSRRWKRLFTGAINLRWFGAVGDGATDDTTAFNTAWSAAMLLPNPNFYMPAGNYKLTTLAAAVVPVTNCVVYGDGLDNTKLKFDTTTGIHLFTRASGSARIENISFRDFHVEGGHGDSGNYSQISTYPFLIYNVNNISFNRIKITKSRVMGMALRGCYGVNVHSCVVQYCARDGINTADCSSVSICNNRVEYVDDDSIAGHNSLLSGLTDRQYVVSGNTVRFAQGIKLLGAISATITGNNVEFFMGQGIDVQTIAAGAGVSEGVNAGCGVVITGNSVKNGIDRAIVDGLTNGTPYIRIGGASDQAGTLAATPGENDTATGTIVPLYPYLDNSSGSSTTVPIPASYGYVISDNILIRDIDSTGLLSSYGFGTFYTRTGPIDPTLTLAGVKITGINIQPGVIRNVDIHDNQFMGLNSALEISSTPSCRGFFFHHNTVYDCKDAVSVFPGNTNMQGVYITDNIIDIDPLLIHANRGANGTWTVTGTPYAFLLNSGVGLIAARNIIRNVNNISDFNVHSSSSLQTNQVVFFDNILDCDPLVSGAFDVTNKGIGSPPNASSMFRYRIVDSDPTSSTYGKVLNNCTPTLNSLPTTGKFVNGHIVYKVPVVVAGSGGSQYMIIGWIRMNTGTAHVLNTDWREMRVLTGT